MKDNILRNNKNCGTKRGKIISLKSKPGKGFSQDKNSPVERVLHLQRTIGNRAVNRLIKSGALQGKLTIGKPGDIYEKEADRMADRVMSIPETSLTQRKSTCPECPERKEIQARSLVEQITPLVQRQAEEEEEKPLQSRAVSGQTPKVSPNIESNINTMKGGGQPLSETIRAFFEPRFGADFSQVRVHNDSRAAQTAQAINAKAFTTGKDIAFNSGQYSPGTSSGKQLLAHELTHVVQQKGIIGRRFVSTVPHAIQPKESGADIKEERNEPSIAAAPASSGPEITLETGNIGAGFLNNLVHQQICVNRPAQDSKRCFSFAATGVQLPQFSSKWLGWDSLVIGAILKGEIYEPSPVPGATVVDRHTPTATQADTWLRYILSSRLGLEDGYSVARHNCRTYSQWEFRDAPGHW